MGGAASSMSWQHLLSSARMVLMPMTWSCCLQVPQFAEYGRLFKSSEPVQLTEEETEYNIVVIKHVFPNHTVLQFQCTNTVQEQVLEDVSVSVDLSEAVSHHRFAWPCL